MAEWTKLSVKGKTEELEQIAAVMGIPEDKVLEII